MIGITKLTSNFRASSWFVTGASGLVGSSIVEVLKENDLSVIALVRESTDPSKIDWLEGKGAKLVYGDILHPQTYEQYLATCDIVVHAAAAVQIKDKEINWQINYEGTKKLLEAMSKFGNKRIIHVSTAGVYGAFTNDEVEEDATLKPKGAYVESKLAAEKLYQEYSEINYTLIRPPFIYGDPEHDRHVIPTLLNLPRLMPKVWGKNPELGFVHAEDVAKLVLLVGSVENTPSRVYNVQSFSIRYTDIIEMVNSVRNKTIRVISLPYFILKLGAWLADIVYKLKKQPYGVTHKLKSLKYNWVFSTKRAVEELGWSPLHHDPKELEVLLSEYYNEKNNIENIASDIRKMTKLS